MPDVREAAEFQWDRAGQQYELENEAELKNELDYGLINLPDYPLRGKFFNKFVDLKFNFN